MWTTMIFSGTAALWHLHWVRRLPALDALTLNRPTSSAAVGVRCSVVIAARDEEARIEQRIRHLLAQRGRVAG